MKMAKTGAMAMAAYKTMLEMGPCGPFACYTEASFANYLHSRSSGEAVATFVK